MLTPREALVTLNLIPGLGSIRIQSLLEHFGSAELVLSAPSQLLERVPRVGPKLAAAVADWRNCTNAQAELACAADYGAQVITLLDDDYPNILRRMSDPPIVLYALGAWQQHDSERSVAIVGTRQASAYGMTQARRFGRELADAGCCIVSGLARGIDTAAHLGALDAGGRTLAVIGSGLSHIFPPENKALAEQILQGGHGAIISEYPMHLRPSRSTFPQRNRIVAAWSQATLVAEAPTHSGALHTAKLANETYGRSVFAIPGPIDRPTSAGCHSLIRDGAILCSHPQELLADMGWDGRERQLELFETVSAGTYAEMSTQAPLPPQKTDRHPNRPQVPTSQRPILNAIAQGFETLDQLCSALGMSAAELTPQLMQLVIAHHLTTLPGGRYKVL